MVIIQINFSISAVAHASSWAVSHNYSSIYSIEVHSTKQKKRVKSQKFLTSPLFKVAPRLNPSCRHSVNQVKRPPHPVLSHAITQSHPKACKNPRKRASPPFSLIKKRKAHIHLCLSAAHASPKQRAQKSKCSPFTIMTGFSSHTLHKGHGS